MNKNIGIVGLGLIGASFAKAYKEYTNHPVFGWNRTHAVTEKALADMVIDEELTTENMKQMDILIVCLFPQACVDYILNNLKHLKPGTIIIDIAGVKGIIIEQVEHACKNSGIIFVGGHPMAGLEVIGYDNSIPHLFQGASMILVPNVSSTPQAINFLSGMFKQLGFGMIIECNAQKHDKMIGYTSQLCHVVSNAFVKNEAAQFHKGFSGGSYRDLTRVAKLNEHMWNELFLLNKEALLEEINEFMGHMDELKVALELEDQEKLTDLLRIGSERKQKYK